MQKMFEKAALFLEIQTFNLSSTKIEMNNENATDVIFWAITDNAMITIGVEWRNTGQCFLDSIAAF